MRYAAGKLNVKPGEFVKQYKEFQKAVRQATAIEVNPQMLARRGSDAPGHEIFSNWRSGYWHSIIAFCNAFCLHPEIVRSYEDGIRPEMPASIRSVLLETGVLDPNWIDDPKRFSKPEALSFVDSHQAIKGDPKFGPNSGNSLNSSAAF